jgi:hypothetical protein
LQAVNQKTWHFSAFIFVFYPQFSIPLLFDAACTDKLVLDVSIYLFSSQIAATCKRK